MDANKRRDQGWSSSEMPTALLVTLSAPRLCSPTLGCTCRNTCFLVCVQYWGGVPSAQVLRPPLPGESPPWGGWRLENACLEFSEVWELVSPLPAPKLQDPREQTVDMPLGGRCPCWQSISEGSQTGQSPPPEGSEQTWGV